MYVHVCTCRSNSKRTALSLTCHLIQGQQCPPRKNILPAGQGAQGGQCTSQEAGRGQARSVNLLVCTPLVAEEVTRGLLPCYLPLLSLSQDGYPPVAFVTARHQGPLACSSSPAAPGFQTQRPSQRLTPALDLPSLTPLSPHCWPLPARPCITGFSPSSLPTINDSLDLWLSSIGTSVPDGTPPILSN